jgi:hypothetical protein
MCMAIGPMVGAKCGDRLAALEPIRQQVWYTADQIVLKLRWLPLSRLYAQGAGSEIMEPRLPTLRQESVVYMTSGTLAQAQMVFCEFIERNNHGCGCSSATSIGARPTRSEHALRWRPD